MSGEALRRRYGPFRGFLVALASCLVALAVVRFALPGHERVDRLDLGQAGHPKQGITVTVTGVAAAGHVYTPMASARTAGIYLVVSFEMVNHGQGGSAAFRATLLTADGRRFGDVGFSSLIAPPAGFACSPGRAFRVALDDVEGATLRLDPVDMFSWMPRILQVDLNLDHAKTTELLEQRNAALQVDTTCEERVA